MNSGYQERTRQNLAEHALENPHPIQRPESRLFVGEVAWFADSCDESLRRAFSTINFFFLAPQQFYAFRPRQI
jgi:hypothetical protein